MFSNAQRKLLFFHFLALFLHGSLNFGDSNGYIDKEYFDDSIFVFAHSLKVSHKSLDRSSLCGFKPVAFLTRIHKSNNLINFKRLGNNRQSSSNLPRRAFPPFSLGLFGSLRNWFVDTFTGGWYVPPMPTGQKASVRMKQTGPVQTDVETESFFNNIGVPMDASLEEIGAAYEHALNTLPEDMHKLLENSFNEYIRKQLIHAFEHMESYMDRGPEAWKEFWNPKKDVFGNEINEKNLEMDEELMIERIPSEFRVDEFREYWEKKSSRFSRIISGLDLPSLLRITKDIKGRCIKCITTMVPTMIFGCIPRFSSLSIAIESLFASKFIYSGDLDQTTNEDTEMHNIHPSRTTKRATSMKTLITLLVIFLHSTLGLAVSMLLQLYTNVADSISPEILNTICVNSQLILAALLYDTSDMSSAEQIKRNEELFAPIKDTINELDD